MTLTLVNNGDTGLVARTKINNAISCCNAVWDAKVLYNLDNTGEVDNAVALAALQADLLAIAQTIDYDTGSPGYPAGARPMPKVIFQPGVYGTSAWPNFAIPNLWMEASGQVELWKRGFGVNVFGEGFVFDSPAIWGGTTGALNVTFKGFKIVCAGTLGNSLVLKAIHHSHFNDIHIMGAGVDFLSSGVHYSCLRIEHCVATEFGSLHISAFDNIDSVVTPISGGTLTTNYGVGVFQLFPPGFLSSACTFFNAVIEGPLTGVYFDTQSGGAMTFHGGTIEGCLGTGVTIKSGNRNNYFASLDMESNPIDFLCEAGSQDNYAILCGTGGTAIISDAGTNNNFNFAGSNYNNQLRMSQTPSFTQATIDQSTQAGISIANGANAFFCPGGQGMLCVVCNRSSTSTIVALVGGGGVDNLNNALPANWDINTITPGAGFQSLSFDGATGYKIYNNTGGTVVYSVMVFKPF